MSSTTPTLNRIDVEDLEFILMTAEAMAPWWNENGPTIEYRPRVHSIAPVIANFTRTERERIKASPIVVTRLEPQNDDHPLMLMLPVERLPSGEIGYTGIGYVANGYMPAGAFEQVVCYSLEKLGIERLPQL